MSTTTSRARRAAQAPTAEDRPTTRDRLDVLAHAGDRQWFRIENADSGSDGEQEKTRAKVYLYDVIGSWMGVTAADFVRELTALDVDEIELHINSPGGLVYDGIAITNALRQHDARVVTVVDGLAASAASFIAVGGSDELVMAENSELFVHDALVLAIGNAQDLRDTATDLDRISDNIASVYARKTGGTAESWREVMREERFYTAAEAVEAGLADRVGTGETAPPKQDDGSEATNRWNPAVFAGGARHSTPAASSARAAVAAHAHKLPAASAVGSTSPAAAASGDTTQEGASTMNEEQLATLRQKLGVADDADSATVLDALDEVLQEQVTEEQPSAARQVPEGMSLVDSDTLASLREDAAAGREARTQQQNEHRHSLVQAAVRDGRIAPARAQAWEQRLAADPEEESTLASLEKGLVPFDEKGHAGEGPQSTDTTQDLYTQAWGNQQTQEG